MAVICKLREFVQEKELTQMKLAAETGLSPTIIGHLYNNQFKRIDCGTAETLCNYFGCDFGDLFKIVRAS